MNPDLTVVDEKKVIFQGRAYSRRSVNKSDLLFEQEEREGNPKYVSFASFDWERDQIFNRNQILYLPDSLETGKYFRNFVVEKGFRNRLAIMKGAVTDQRLPSRLVNEGCDEDIVDEDHSYVYPWEEHFGRDWILDRIKEYHFLPATPDVRQVVLHDTSPYLKVVAMNTLASLGGRVAANTLCEKLMDKSELILVREAAAMTLKRFHYAESVEALKRTFEETTYSGPDKLYSGERGLLENMFGADYWINRKVASREWMPQICLDSLASIPAVEALGVLENASKSILAEISSQARDSIIDWVKLNIRLLDKIIDKKRILSEKEEERLNLVRRLIYRYDIDSKSKFYDTPFGRFYPGKKLKIHLN